MSLDAQRHKDLISARANWWLTIIGLVLANAGAKLFPQYFTHLCNNAELSTAIALGVFNVASAIKVWLDHKAVKAAKGALVWVGTLFLVGCATAHQQLDPKVEYKRDVGIEVNGRRYEGVVTVPYAKAYSFVLEPKGEIDLMLIRTCHRTYSVEKVSSGWFGKNKFAYGYTPIEGLEDVRTCPIRLDVYESSKAGRHSWAFIDFENPLYQIQAELTCDGSIRHVNGVGVCQAKKETVQRIRFSEAVRFAPPKPDHCSRPVRVNGAYEFLTSLGECLYHFDTKDGRLGRLTIIGFEGVLIREGQ